MFGADALEGFERHLPDLAKPDRGVVGVAGARLQVRIEKMLQELVMRNRSLIELRGPR